MTHIQLQKFLSYLTSKDYFVFAPAKPKKQRGEAPFVEIKQVADYQDFQFINELPLHSFKRFLVLQEEVLFEYKGVQMSKPDDTSLKQALFVSVLDLKALLLWNQEFEKDPYYQERLRNTLIIGYSLIPVEQDQNIFHAKYEESILEHLQFDIFFEIQKSTPLEIRQGHKTRPRGLSPSRNFALTGRGVFLTGSKYFLYTGSEKGQEIIEDFGYKDYQHIQFVGPIKEEGQDKRMLSVRDKMVERHNPKIWEDLNKKCIECGKCSVICPTCFCFNIYDEPGMRPEEGRRKRSWGVCFYSDFSEVAGGKKFLNNAGERIHFWYEHKFVRIPGEFGFPGCIGCGRCSKVCPVGIDIAENLEKILKS